MLILLTDCSSLCNTQVMFHFSKHCLTMREMVPFTLLKLVSYSYNRDSDFSLVKIPTADDFYLEGSKLF